MLGSLALMAQQQVETREFTVDVPVIMEKPVFFYSVPIQPHDTIATMIRSNGYRTVMEATEKIVADVYHNYPKFDAVLISGKKCERIYVIKFK